MHSFGINPGGRDLNVNTVLKVIFQVGWGEGGADWIYLMCLLIIVIEYWGTRKGGEFLEYLGAGKTLLQGISLSVGWLTGWFIIWSVSQSVSCLVTC
jgi:hypothetical protein